MIRCFVSFLFVTLTVFTAPAQDNPKTEASSENAQKKEEEKESAPPVTKTNQVTIDGVLVEYEVTAATISLPDPKDPEADRADVFYTSYVVAPDEDAEDRPIAFCFNGGPGSSSVWLHLGGLGPRRVKLDEAGAGTTLPPPPYGVVDNEFSILDVVDLVFIDPVSTGFSRAEDTEERGSFHGLEGDIESVGAFIHQYCSAHGRWDSPKYLIGESYGGIRAAGLSEFLQERFGMYLNGIVLVSALLDFSTILFHQGNDTPYILFLPSYAATAAYHGASTAASPEEAYESAHEFAFGDYANALLKGNTLDPETETLIAEQLVQFTGLEADDIRRANLRPDAFYFRKMLLRSQGKSVGRFDARVLGIDPDKAGTYPDYDASGAAVMGPFSSAMNHYLREEIGF
ncbi:MAG: peptidase S10, partial [Verrucomicrobiota bacterium]